MRESRNLDLCIHSWTWFPPPKQILAGHPGCSFISYFFAISNSLHSCIYPQIFSSSDLKLKMLQKLSKTRPLPWHNTLAAISSPRFGCSTWIVLLCFTAPTETSRWIAALYSVTDRTQCNPAFCKMASLNISPGRKAWRGWKREQSFLFMFADLESELSSPQTSTAALVHNHNQVHRRSPVAVPRLMQAGCVGWSRLETGVIPLVYGAERQLCFIPRKFTLSVGYSGERLCQDFVQGKKLVHSLETWHHPRNQLSGRCQQQRSASFLLWFGGVFILLARVVWR